MVKKYDQTLKSFFYRYQTGMKLGGPAFLIALIFFVAAISNVSTQTYNLDKFSTAPETIYAPITIEDEKETEQRISEVIQSIEDRYSLSETVTESRIQLVTEVFEAAEEIRKTMGEGASIDEQMTSLRSLLSDEIKENFPLNFFRPLLLMDKSDFAAGKDLLLSALHSSFQEGIRSSDLEREERTLELKIEFSSLKSFLQPVLIGLGTFSLVENALFDPEKTEEARKSAISKVEPAMIRAGDVIVEEGATITNEVYEELQLTGLLEGQRNFLPYLGLGVVALFLGAIFYFESIRSIKTGKLTLRHIYVLTAISALMIVMMKSLSMWMTVEEPAYYFMPIGTGVFLVKLLCNERLAIVMAMVYSLIAIVLFNGQMVGLLNGQAGLYLALSQLASIYLLVQTRDRLSIIKASTGTAFVNIGVILFIVFLSFEKYSWTEVFLFTGYGVAGAYIAGVLTLGLLPFIETWFGILSDNKLLTLASPNQPLLRKILIEAPGTYHHSIMVANLSESACESIGANGLLARVASYYHDLGKTVKPHYFIENQMGMRNPHDFLDAEQSAEIIIQHPYDGAEILEKKGLPDEIINIAKQHHGTTLLKYFYYQAREKDSSVGEADFRYPGPKPQSKEAAIVCVCDSVEAAVRSIEHPTEDKIKKIVHSIIEDRLLDGQFDESDLTFKEIKKMEHAICETLHGIFHSRIQYPDSKKAVKEA